MTLMCKHDFNYLSLACNLIYSPSAKQKTSTFFKDIGPFHLQLHYTQCVESNWFIFFGITGHIPRHFPLSGMK